MKKILSVLLISSMCMILPFQAHAVNGRAVQQLHQRLVDNGWEYIGEVPLYNENGTISSLKAKIYAKSFGNNVVYKGTIGDKEYAVSIGSFYDSVTRKTFTAKIDIYFCNL